MPGIHLVYSNRMEALAEKLAERFSIPLPSPFTPETVLVQSRGMQRWLSMELSRRLGICANVRFPFPVAFLHDLLRDNLPALSDKYPFDQERMRWRIMETLHSGLEDPEFGILREYVQDDGNGTLRFGLARKIASLFDRYLVFRPDMLATWEQGGRSGDDPAERWQAGLWRLLVKEIGSVHRARLQELFIRRLLDGGRDLRLPQRIALFGISTLPPAHLCLFHALAQHIDVSFFVLSPCREFWEDLVSSRRKSRILSGRTPEGGAVPLYLDEGHPLLASWGGVNQVFQRALNELTQSDFQDHYQDPGRATLLHCLQSDILDLHSHAELGEQGTVSGEDRSIRIHSCHSPMREVEALYDTLLSCCDADPTLHPRDILVMAPDIETYAPYVQAVFGSPETESLKIPFSIADKSVAGDSGLIRSFLDLLDAASGRLAVNAVLALLESAPVAARFGLQKGDVERIHYWVGETRIRWGGDEDSRSELGLPPFRENSWEAGLERLLLGLAMHGDGRRRFADILPYGDIEGSLGEPLGRFVDFFHLLGRLARTTHDRCTPRQWAELLLETLAECFEPQRSDLASLQLVRSALDDLRSLPAESGFERPLPFAVVRSWLEERFARPVHEGSFMTGGVTFCAMVPMRSIPFRVVCLLGLNHDAFPRRETPVDFDLTARAPLPGDRNVRLDDRSLFLEALLSARDALLLSFVGRDIQSNLPKPASVLVIELLDTLDRDYLLADGRRPSQALVQEHPLQSFGPEYFRPSGPLFSYSPDRCAGARNLLKAGPTLPSLLRDELPQPPDELRTSTLDELVGFFLDPSQTFLRRRVGADPRLRSSLLEEEESLAGLGGLEGYGLGQEMLSWLERGEAPEELLHVARAQGLLPPLAMGAAVFERVREEVCRLHASMRALAGSRADDLPLHIELDGFTLTGRVTSIFEAGLLQARYTGTIKGRDLLTAWIRLLAASVQSGRQCRVFVLSRGSTCRLLTSPPDSAAVLSTLLRLRWSGLSRPLCFFPETSMAYAEALLGKGSTHEQALQEALRKWSSLYDHAKEGERPATLLCFPEPGFDEPFQAAAVEICGPLLRAMAEHRL
jgi:exodeoxyribonuclease V gamma subunit